MSILLDLMIIAEIMSMTATTIFISISTEFEDPEKRNFYISEAKKGSVITTALFLIIFFLLSSPYMSKITDPGIKNLKPVSNTVLNFKI